MFCGKWWNYIVFIVREALDKSLSKIIRENDFYRISPLSIDDLVVNYSSVVSHIWFTGAFYVCHKTTKHIILLNIILFACYVCWVVVDREKKELIETIDELIKLLLNLKKIAAEIQCLKSWPKNAASNN